MVFGPATDLCFDPSLLPENQQFFCTIPPLGQSLLSLSLYSNEDGAVFEWKNWKLPTLNVKVAKSQNHIFSTSFHLHKNEENYARLNTYFHEFVFRQNCQSTKNRLQDFHFHAFRFCLSCLASVTKVTKPLLI